MNDDEVDDLVIGSGPNGWAACMGIWARGGKPLVVDIGYTANYRSGESVIRNTVVKSKTRFESDHMYSFPLNTLSVSPPEGVIPLTGARGGHSTVWGAGIQPVSDADLKGIPDSVKLGWLRSSKELLSQLDFLGRNDLLSQRDPWPVEPHDQVALTPRFQKILNRTDVKQSVGRSEVLYGSPRLAITGSSNRNRHNACILCGQCMTGCPEGSIFDSSIAIEHGINKFGGTRMIGVVTKIYRENDISKPTPTDCVVEVELENRKTCRIAAKRVYLAAGPIGTPLILQKSGLAPTTIEVRDSQMFYSAFFSRDRFFSTNEAMTTSQGYFSTKLGVAQEREFSMSVYEYSNEFRTRLDQLTPKFMKSIVGFFNPLMTRIVPGIGFLSQDVSGTIRLVYDGHKTEIKLCVSKHTKTAVRSARKRLRRTAFALGLLQLPNPFKSPGVGAGFHAGASMPMGESNESLIDWNGRLKVLPSIRVVDTSSLMRIKAGSHTFMAMANAHRIALNID